MPLPVTSLPALAAQIKRAFEPIEAAQVDELGVYVIIAHGRFGWQRHMDEDELILVLSGSVLVESEWGAVTLHGGELAALPKGVGHRSSSMWRSTVLLLRPKLLANAQNGHRRVFGLPREGGLEKVAVAPRAAQAPADYTPTLLGRVGAYTLSLRRGAGAGLWTTGAARLLLAYSGRVLVKTSGEETTLNAGELVVLPAKTPCRLSAAEECIVLEITREEA